MSKTIIENLRCVRSRLDWIDARCAERKANIDRLKAEGCGGNVSEGWIRSGWLDGAEARDVPVSSPKTVRQCVTAV